MLPEGLIVGQYQRVAPPDHQEMIGTLADQAGSYTINPSGKTTSAMWPVSGWTGDGDPMVVNAYNTNDAAQRMITPP